MILALTGARREEIAGIKAAVYPFGRIDLIEALRAWLRQRGIEAE
ncbi:hypothetical protein [Martelella mediterranea]|nr:hypothetical protein [Martelella mediterranea]